MLEYQVSLPQQGGMGFGLDSSRNLLLSVKKLTHYTEWEFARFLALAFVANFGSTIPSFSTWQSSNSNEGFFSPYLQLYLK